jgi:hypothetical protein
LSNFTALFLLSEKPLRRISIGVGFFFIAIAGLLRITKELAAGETYLVLLYPSLTGLALIAAGATLNVTALRAFWLLWFVALPVLFWLVSDGGCALGWLPISWCR